MRLVVTGAGGQLGTDLLRLAPGRPEVAHQVGYRHGELDVTDSASVQAMVARESRLAAAAGGLVVVNTAAWTDVDGAESDEAGAHAVNAAAPALLASACAARDAVLVHLSTDYVFAGDRPPDGPPYTPADEPAPRCAFGRTKLAGEQAVRTLHPDGGYVVRTAWLYGPGANFVSTMARLAGQSETVDVVDDQTGSPTYTADLAVALLALASLLPPPGVYHATNSGATTWYGLARETFALLGHDPGRVRPTTTAAFRRPAPRPAYSVLDGTSWAAAGLPPLRPWSEALHAAAATAGGVPGLARG